MARCCGLDRQSCLANDLSATSNDRAQKLWWSVCVLDQRLAATVNATPDSLIHQRYNNSISLVENPEHARGFRLRANLSICNILTKVMTGNDPRSFSIH